MQKAWTATGKQGTPSPECTLQNTLQIFRHCSYREIPELTTNSRAWALEQTSQQRTQQCRMICPRQRAAAHLALHSLTPSYFKQQLLPLQAALWIDIPLSPKPASCFWHHSPQSWTFPAPNTISPLLFQCLIPAVSLLLLPYTPCQHCFAPTPQPSLLIRSKLEFMSGSSGNQRA